MSKMSKSIEHVFGFFQIFSDESDDSFFFQMKKRDPGKMVPGKNDLQKNGPRKIGSRKNCPGKLRNKKSWGVL